MSSLRSTDLEEFVGFFVTGDGSDGLDHGVALVVYSGLDAVAESDPQGSLLALVLLPETGVGTHGLGEEGVVLKYYMNNHVEGSA